MFRVTRRYQFSASHRLYSPLLSELENERVYGKCAQPYGHGHNYVVEVSARGPIEPVSGRAVDTDALDRLVQRHVLQPFDHHNLNVEVEAFRTTVPTAESLALEIGRRLKQNWKAAFPAGGPRLERIRIEETPRNTCEIGADEIE